MENPGLFHFDRRDRRFFVVVLICMVILYGFQYRYERARDLQIATQKSQAMAITADALARQFTKDPARSLEKYEGKWLRITGKVMSSGPGSRGKFYIRFAVMDDTSQVRFFTGQDQSQWVLSLKPGDKITVVGMCRGYSSKVVVVE